MSRYILLLILLFCSLFAFAQIPGGSGNFTDVTATIHYETINGITNPAALRIGKDDGGANWIDIGGAGSGLQAGSITSNTFSAFSDFDLTNLTGGSLPVTLQSFTANLINLSVQLNWKVENEERFDLYEIERGINGSAYTTAAIRYKWKTIEA